ncbi:MAPEG family protein [Phreatobacter cathodiphilus]|uniref:Glutathione metabolism protein n=1 Tax=Phreatobacter cathodiphilus TaxID=1868589 RepID=A0A2S0NHK3_9HYPH|nr:MAPEG family protein [Phreatobacter cathodiphilus]AVO47401.1 glutathione metabolism protein [Phreatobacter cathodiphilus]
MPITALYAALLALLFVVLSVRVIGFRRAVRIGLGDGGDTALLRRVRVHANFAEYAPFCLVLIGLAESLRAPALLLHALGALLLAARFSHAYGVSRQPETFFFRVAGMVGTLTVIGVAAAVCFYSAARSLG